jgi:hypothetical protein
MPTTATLDFTVAKLEPAYAPELAKTQAFKVKSGTYVKGEVCGFVGTTGAAGAYANGNSDGTETAAVICVYDMYSDGTNVSLTDDGALLSGETRTDAPFYIAGFFECSELTGLDANGVTDMQARLIGANTVSGVLALF